MKYTLSSVLTTCLLLQYVVAQDLPPISANLIQKLGNFEKQTLDEATQSIEAKRAEVIKILKTHLTQLNESGGSAIQIKELAQKILELEGGIKISMSENSPNASTDLSGDIQALAMDSGLASGNKEFTVRADSSPKNPLSTKIHVSKGEVFALYPNPDDKWSAARGSKVGVFCDYKGYGGKDLAWMRMEFNIGKGPGETVHPIRWFTADRDGFLYLYARDDTSRGNKGSIRVTFVPNK